MVFLAPLVFLAEDTLAALGRVWLVLLAPLGFLAADTLAALGRALVHLGFLAADTLAAMSRVWLVFLAADSRLRICTMRCLYIDPLTTLTILTL